MSVLQVGNLSIGQWPDVLSRSSPTTLVNSDRVYLGRSDAKFSCNTLPARSFIITLPYAVQQSVILFARFEARASNDSFALLGVRSSLMKILSVRRSALCDFSLVRARNTSSRTRSLRKRTMMARVRVRPSLSARRPRRWLRSRSSISSGGIISSSVLTISNTLASVSSPWSLSRIPSNRRFGRRVYCSSESFASARSRTSLSRLAIFVSFSWTRCDSLSTVVVSASMRPDNSTGNRAFFRALSTC